MLHFPTDFCPGATTTAGNVQPRKQKKSTPLYTKLAVMKTGIRECVKNKLFQPCIMNW